MSVLNTNTRLLYPTPKSSAEVMPGRHRLNEDLETELISPERRARVLGSPEVVPAVVPEPVAEGETPAEPVKQPMARALAQMVRNSSRRFRWTR